VLVISSVTPLVLGQLPHVVLEPVTAELSDMTDLTKQDAALMARIIRTVTMAVAERKFLPVPFSMARVGDRSKKFPSQ
jgi:hypothetical protein